MRPPRRPNVGGVFRPIGPVRLALDLTVPSLLLLVLLVPYALRAEARAMVFVLAGMCLALAFWRLSPALALAVAWLTAIVQIVLGLPPDPANLAILVVLFSTAAYGRGAVRWLGLASAPVGAAVAVAYLMAPTLLRGPGAWADAFAPGVQGFLAVTAVFALAWTLGLLARTVIAAAESRKAQAAAERDVVIEQERNRIARDMHDVVAHSLAVVIAQADGARYARSAGDEAVDGALAAISTTAREALADVRVLLTQLRHREGIGPQPVLDDLEPLYEQFRASGLRLAIRTAGEPRHVPTATQLAAFRIVQEALTNALRHGTGSAELQFDWRAEFLAVSVQNPLPVPAAAAAGKTQPPELGHGLVGMTERAELVGGNLNARPDGGIFVVEAILPVSSAQPRSEAAR